jgi:cytochrome c oxidase subunit 2
MRKNIVHWSVAVVFFGAFVFAIGVLLFQIPPSAKETEEANKNTLTIAASNFAFDKSTYEVKAGSTLNVQLVNKQGIHGIEIDGLDVQLQGDKLSQTVTFDQPGTYTIKCIVLCGEGHTEMVATVVVA